MASHQLDPRKCNIALDANALDRDATARDVLVDRISELIEMRTLSIVLAGGVRAEIGHSHTPERIKRELLPQIFNQRPSLTCDQKTQRQKVAGIIQGNSSGSKHAADASHLSEAEETGCVYFVTEDQRILKRRPELYRVLHNQLMIVTLEEFFAQFDATADCDDQH